MRMDSRDARKECESCPQGLTSGDECAYNIPCARLVRSQILESSIERYVQISSSDGIDRDNNRETNPVKTFESRKRTEEMAQTLRVYLGGKEILATGNIKQVSQPSLSKGIRSTLSSESLIMAQDERWRRA